MSKVKDALICEYPDEIWLPVAGFEDLYEVSNYGRVRSLRRIAKNRNGYCVLGGNILTPTNGGHGYLKVDLHNGNNVKRAKVHRLVADAFIPNEDKKRCVNHIDGDKTNNHLSNLEWCSHSENNKHAYATGLKSVSDKCKTATANAHKKKVFDITNGRTFDSVREASNVTKICEANIAKCCRGERNHAGGIVWRYCDV